MINQENFSENDTTKDKRLAQKQKIRKEKSTRTIQTIISRIIFKNN